MIVIVDYGVGNLASIKNILKKINRNLKNMFNKLRLSTFNVIP